MDSNDCNAAGGRSQKICSARILQDRQLSIRSRLYGISTTPSALTVTHHIIGRNSLRKGTLGQKSACHSLTPIADKWISFVTTRRRDYPPSRTCLQGLTRLLGRYGRSK